MSTQQNYNKICTECEGKYYLGTIKGKTIGTFLGIALKDSDYSIVCNKCVLGVIKPKQVIHKPGSFEPVVIY